MAPHSSTLAWKIPWMEEPGRLQSMGSLRVGHDWATSLSRVGEGNGNPLQCSCMENPRDGGAWWAAVYGVAQSRTRLKRLSSSSCHSGSLLLKFFIGKIWVVIYLIEKWGEVAQSCPTLCNPLDSSLPGSFLHGILQTRVLEWVAISFSRGSWL